MVLRTVKGALRCTHKNAPRNGEAERRDETEKPCLSRGKDRDLGELTMVGSPHKFKGTPSSVPEALWPHGPDLGEH